LHKIQLGFKTKIYSDTLPSVNRTAVENILLEFKARVGPVCCLGLINTNGNYVKLKNDFQTKFGKQLT